VAKQRRKEIEEPKKEAEKNEAKEEIGRAKERQDFFSFDSGCE
jgi:hypothetical protein